jgi:hypothetical protein
MGAAELTIDEAKRPTRGGVWTRGKPYFMGPLERWSTRARSGDQRTAPRGTTMVTSGWEALQTRTRGVGKPER